MALSPRSGWVTGALAEVNAAYEAFLAVGFPTAEFEGQPEPERLQCRNELDRTNWLGLLAKCKEAELAAAVYEQPWILAQPIDPPLRCSSNRMYAVSYADAKARMLALLNAVGEAQAIWWGLKDQVRAAESRQELNAIDIEGAWS